MEFCKVTLTFESADEILWCGHSNETSLPVLTHCAICYSKFRNLVEICFWLNLAVNGLKDSTLHLHCTNFLLYGIQKKACKAMFLSYCKSHLLQLFQIIKLTLFLNPKSGQHQFSPKNTYSLSREKVMGIYQMVTKKNPLIFHQILSTNNY